MEGLLDDEWGTCLGAVYDWLKGEEFSLPLVFIARLDRSQATFEKLDKPIRTAHAPSNRKYTNAPEPCRKVFMGEHVMWRIHVAAIPRHPHESHESHNRSKAISKIMKWVPVVLCS